MKIATISFRSALAAAALLCPAWAGAANVDLVITSREVVLSGLNAPRGMAFGPDGGLYVTESGHAFNIDEAQHIETPQGDFYFGLTGSVTRLLDGVQTTVFSGLPTLYAPSKSEAIGPQDIVFTSNGDAYIAIGMGLDVAARTDSFMQLGNIVKIAAGTTTPTLFADIAAYEGAHNPAGDDVHSNPFRIAAAPGGGFLVIDAGANALLSVSSEGEISTRAVVPPPGGGAQSGPTAWAVGADGRLFVGELTGFPFTPGSARIFSLEGEGGPLTLATGFTHIIDMALGQDGTLFVLEHDSNGMLVPGALGSLYAFNPDSGERKLLLSDLVAPTGLAIDELTGTLFISNYGNGDGAGEVLALSFAPVPEPQTWAFIGLGLLLGWQRARRGRLAGA